LPEGMPARMLTFRWFAKTYGWTPDQVRENLSEEEFEWFPKIETAAARAAEDMQKEAARESRSSHRGF
jgi:hypothetical protein